MKKLTSILAIILVLCTLLSTVALAAETTYIRITIEEDPGTYYVTGESSHLLTLNTNLLAEVVGFINENYKVNRKLYGFQSPAMQKIMDKGLDAYFDSDAAWKTYVDTYYNDVNNLHGLRLKEILKDKKSVLGDLQANVEYQITFKNDVAGDPKYGTLYTVTIVRFAKEEQAPVQPAPTTTDAKLNKADHFAYVTGYPDGSFGPNRKITREETTMIFYRLLTRESLERFASNRCSFSDVKEGRWSYEAIATMANAGVITGYPNGTFAPAKNVTRAEFATIAARFLSEPYDGINRFPDAAGHWAEAAINRAAVAGWIKGDNGMFRPNDYITRAEAVTLINRMLDRQPETVEDLSKDMITFTDNLDTTKWFYLAVQEAANGHDFVRKGENTVFESWTKLH